MTADRYRIESDLIPGGQRALIQWGDERWTLAVFKGTEGEAAAHEVARLLNAHAVADERLPDKWNGKGK